MLNETPLTGNAVITTTWLTFIVGVVIVLLRSFGYQITGDQENVILVALQGPLGEVIIGIVLWIGARVSWENVYSRLSVRELTGRVDPSVP
jgi:hypothetical protein